MFSEEEKAQMLRDCFSIFVKQGLENTSISDLAKQCHTYKAALYNYFKSKDEIVIEGAKMYMTDLDEILQKVILNPKGSLEEALSSGFEILRKETNNLRYIYQVVSSPKYGRNSREALSEIYMKYLDYSKVFAEIYGVEHDKFRPYFLLFVSTMHDYCMWGNEILAKEKLNYIFNKVTELEKNKAN